MRAVRSVQYERGRSETRPYTNAERREEWSRTSPTYRSIYHVLPILLSTLIKLRGLTRGIRLVMKALQVSCRVILRRRPCWRSLEAEAVPTAKRRLQWAWEDGTLVCMAHSFTLLGALCSIGVQRQHQIEGLRTIMMSTTSNSVHDQIR